MFGKPAVVARYETQLANEWQILENEMLDTLGVSKAEWMDFMQNYRYKYDAFEDNLKREERRNGQPLSNNFKNLALQLFQKINMNPGKVDLIRNESSGRRLHASRSAIYVSENKLANDTPNEIEASLLHELGHIVNSDDEFIYFLEKFYEWYGKKSNGFLGSVIKNFYEKPAGTKGITAKVFKAVRKKIRHFQEKREDTWAALYSIVYARALLSIYKRMRSKYKDRDSETHPSFSKRIRNLQYICSDMENDPDMRDGQVCVR